MVGPLHAVGRVHDRLAYPQPAGGLEDQEVEVDNAAIRIDEVRKLTTNSPLRTMPACPPYRTTGDARPYPARKETRLTTHDVQHIRIDVPMRRAFAYISDASRLPEWTQAFAAVNGSTALMRTPRGEVEVGLEVLARREQGTVDWRMAFPDGTTEIAYSRLVPAGSDATVFSFVLLPPEAALEQLEGGLEQQAAILADELRNLKARLENGSTD